MRGKKIVITRAQHQAGELASLLSEYGAEALLYPCIAIVPPEDTRQLDDAVREMSNGGFDWLVLTSANAVKILGERLATTGLTPPSHLALACVGPSTAEAAQRVLGMQARAVPESYVAESLVELLKPALPARVLLLQAEKARPVVRERLEAAGAMITALTAYRTALGEGGVHLSALLKTRQVDAITFTSASTVENCVRRLRAEGAGSELLAHACLACIGPVTAQAMVEAGLVAGVMPIEYTIKGMIEALEAYFRSLAKGQHVHV